MSHNAQKQKRSWGSIFVNDYPRSYSYYIILGIILTVYNILIEQHSNIHQLLMRIQNWYWTNTENLIAYFQKSNSQLDYKDISNVGRAALKLINFIGMLLAGLARNVLILPGNLQGKLYDQISLKKLSETHLIDLIVVNIAAMGAILLVVYCIALFLIYVKYESHKRFIFYVLFSILLFPFSFICFPAIIVFEIYFACRAFVKYRRIHIAATVAAQAQQSQKPDKRHAQASSSKKTVQQSPLKIAYNQLNNMIGLERVKSELNEIIAVPEHLAKIRKVNSVKGGQNGNSQGADKPGIHILMLGNPGTGKTEVARLLSKIFYYTGVTQKDVLVEVDRSKLVGPFIGHSEPNLWRYINQARGGILFIDEAYSLYKKDDTRDFGNDIINTLNKAMEDLKGELIVIAAGYRGRMLEFLNSNSGLKSRFNVTLEFDDYTEDELYRIFLKMCRDKGLTITDAAKKIARQEINRIYRTRTRNFGNAREIRNFVEACMKRLAIRTRGWIADKKIITLTAEDILPDWSKKKIGTENLTKELNSMIGLKGIKKQLNLIINHAKMESERRRGGNKASSNCMHLVFTGNPGTGKTTVARMLGNIYHGLDILPSSHLVVVSRQNLISARGDTAERVADYIEKSIGGVLFIDEAYSLNDTYGAGEEVINILVESMDMYRESLMVILAGYPDEMEKLLDKNVGLRSRIADHIHFPDFTDEELVEIFKKMCKDDRLEYDNHVLNTIRNVIKNTPRDKYFGNARYIREMIRRASMKRDSRLNRINEADRRGKLCRFESSDFIEH